MTEASLRVRVNKIRKDDPEFFETMVDLRESYKENRKKGGDWHFMDRRWLTKWDDHGRIVKKPFTIEDTLEFIWWKWNDEDLLVVA